MMWDELGNSNNLETLGIDPQDLKIITGHKGETDDIEKYWLGVQLNPYPEDQSEDAGPTIW